MIAILDSYLCYRYLLTLKVYRNEIQMSRRKVTLYVYLLLLSDGAIYLCYLLPLSCSAVCFCWLFHLWIAYSAVCYPVFAALSDSAILQALLLWLSNGAHGQLQQRGRGGAAVTPIRNCRTKIEPQDRPAAPEPVQERRKGPTEYPGKGRGLKSPQRGAEGLVYKGRAGERRRMRTGLPFSYYVIYIDYTCLLSLPVFCY